MLILISPAKLMRTVIPPTGQLTTTHPVWEDTARRLAFEMSGKSIAELAQLLGIKPTLAEEVHQAYQDFSVAPLTPAIYAYDGIVFKHISPESLSAEEMGRMCARLRICSFLYGLLRPGDAIRPYRMEGDVALDETEGETIFAYFRTHLTDHLIAEVQAEGGTLLFLASEEMKQLFDWKRVTKSIRVLQPLFKIRKGDKVKQIVVYTKMMRGAMCRHAITGDMAGTHEEMLAYADIIGASETQISRDGSTYTYII